MPKNQGQREFKAIWDEADKAGKEAVERLRVTPMIVSQHRDMLDDSSPVVKSYYVGDGICGFAWVDFPGNTSFGRWAKLQKLARPYTHKAGLTRTIVAYGQSYERKRAYAYAFANVLVAHGIKAYSQSRLD